MLETLEILIGGRPIDNFVDFSMTFGAEQAVRHASVVMGGPVSEADFPFPDMPATIRANGELLLTGTVRDATPGHQDAEGGQIWEAEITIVSKTVDSTESSIVHQTGEVRDSPLVALANTIESAGVTWNSIGALFDVPLHRIVPGRSAYQEIEELARSRGVLLYDNERGDMVLADKPAGRHTGGLALGVNILQAQAQLTGYYRHDPVIVRGQASTGSGGGALRPQAEVANTGLGRRRPTVILFEGEPTMEALKGRAEQEIRRREGRARSATCTLSGWRDQAGKIWSPNHLVHLDNPLIFVEQDMLINAVTLTQNEGGTRAMLALIDAQAMNGEDAKGAGDAFNIPKAQASISIAPAPTSGEAGS